MEDKITLTIEKQKNIALIAHDGKKPVLIDWCEKNKDILKNHNLCGTGTTARMISDRTCLTVKGYNIKSKFMDECYDHDVINFQKNIENRANTL